MQASKSAVAADYNQAKVKVGNLEAAVTTLKKEKEDQAANHPASHFTCVCQAKQGCRKTVFDDLCVSRRSACVLLCITPACLCCTLLPCCAMWKLVTGSADALLYFADNQACACHRPR